MLAPLRWIAILHGRLKASLALTGGLAAGGLWMIWLSGRKTIEQGVRTYLSTLGGRLAAVALIVQIVLAFQVVGAQPEWVRKGLADNIYYHTDIGFKAI